MIDVFQLDAGILMMSEPPPKVGFVGMIIHKGLKKEWNYTSCPWIFTCSLQGDEKPRKKVTEINVRKAIKSFARNALTRQEYYRLLALRDINLFGEIV